MKTKLSKTEELLMRHLWELKHAFMKDLMKQYDDPKPASTTIATLLKRMNDKGFIDYVMKGNAREYFPLVKKEDYFRNYLSNLADQFFGNSQLSLASFFTTSTNMTEDELKELRSIIDGEIKKKSK